jgi:hypothetical protein
VTCWYAEGTGLSRAYERCSGLGVRLLHDVVVEWWEGNMQGDRHSAWRAGRIVIGGLIERCWIEEAAVFEAVWMQQLLMRSAGAA